MSEDTGVDAPVTWPVAEYAELRVRKMQVKLHRWAVADHGFRFDDVFNFVCDPATLVVAFERVAGNTGARTAGVDGLRADHVQAFGAEAYLDQIRSQLKAGVFRPMPVRERMIPKAGGKLRRLGIPTIADRVVQAALKLVLEPIFEADFRPCSYGFRPNRRAHDAIAEIHLFGTQGYRWVLDADIEACFDRIDHTALMGRVRMRMKDKRVLALVKAFLKAGIMTELGERNETTAGTPQGGILSPLLANIALSSLDDFAAEQWTNMMATRRDRERRRQHGLGTWRLVRYADDFVVMVHGTREHVEELRGQVSEVLATMGLVLSPSKTRIVHLADGFDFLGFRIVWNRLAGNGQVVRLHLHRRQAGRGAETEDQVTDPQVVASRLQGHADQDQPDPARLGQLLQARGRQAHLVAPCHLRMVEGRALGDAPQPHDVEGHPAMAPYSARMGSDPHGRDRTVQPRHGAGHPLPLPR